MVDFRLDVDYSVRDSDRKPGNASRQNNTLTDFLITQAISAKYPPPAGPQGNFQPGAIKVPSERRTAGRIHNALTKAINADLQTVSFSEEQVEWIGELLRAWEVPPQWAGWYDDLLDYIDGELRDISDRRKVVKAAESVKA